MREENDKIKHSIKSQRRSILLRLETIMEIPVLVLGFVWLIILIIELIWDLPKTLEIIVYTIWIIFIIDFLLRFILSPEKLVYLKKNWLTIISLIVPALRIFRIFGVLRILRYARATRSIRLLKVLTSINRGMKALQRKLKQRKFGYIVILTIIVIFTGAAGMYAFEKGNQGFYNYGEALWWTAMLITTIGSEFWPRTAEGKILTFILSVYAFSILSYVAAALASFFIGRDAESDKGEIAGTNEIRELKEEIKKLRNIS